MSATDNRLKLKVAYEAFINSFGFDPKDLTTIIITHCDILMDVGDHL